MIQNLARILSTFNAQIIDEINIHKVLKRALISSAEPAPDVKPDAVRYWTQEEKNRIMQGLDVENRSAAAIQTMRWRLKQKLERD